MTSEEGWSGRHKGNCAALSQAGFTDWEVPAQGNLKTIITVASTAVDPNDYYYLPYISPNISTYSSKSYYYWSSEEYDNDSQISVQWQDSKHNGNDEASYVVRAKTEVDPKSRTVFLMS